MGKFLRSLTDGSLRCKYCGDEQCICMEDGITILKMISIWEYPNKYRLNGDPSIFVQLAKQKLPNGKQIPSGQKVFIPKGAMINKDDLLKTITLTNDFLNRLRFD
jgi:hypothetical protein